MLTEHSIDGQILRRVLPSIEVIRSNKLREVSAAITSLLAEIEGEGDSNLKKAARLARAGDGSHQ